MPMMGSLGIYARFGFGPRFVIGKRPLT